MAQVKRPSSLPFSVRPGAAVSGQHRILEFVITEEVQGKPWNYHWSPLAEQELGLCGAETMPAGIAYSNWGVKHQELSVHWCEECQTLKNIILPERIEPAPAPALPTVPDTLGPKTLED